MNLRRLLLLSTVSVALLLTMGWIDYVTGPDIGFSLFYILPVLAGGWYGGRRVATITAVAAASVWFSADFAWRGSAMLPVSAWNGLTRLALYLLIGILAGNQRRAQQALATANRQLSDALTREEQLSRTDSLTGLANVRAFLETVRRELERARRSRSSVCVAYLDLDNFKRVNDTRGHRAGDELLQGVAAALREEVRGGDIPARLAGDEFAVLLWNADRTEVERIGERLVKRVQELGAGYPELQLGASVGIAWFASPPPTEDDVIRAADEAMYRAKSAGKNRVMVELRSAGGEVHAE